MSEANVPLSVFHVRDKSPLDMKLFLDSSGTVDISRSDMVKYPVFEKQANRMFDAMWRFNEINLTKDKGDFHDKLSKADQFIFTANLKRQVVLDTVQSLGLAEALLPLASDPMIKRCINYIQFFEELHNATYEHIIKNVYNDPSEVMDGIKGIDEIIACGMTIGRYYDELIMETAKYRLNMTSLHNLKKKLWMCIQSINALEGIRFFVSFACSFAFGNSGRMIGNSSLIRLIANDESMHVAFTTVLLRTLPRDDEEFMVIEEEMREEASAMFHEVVTEEKNFLPFAFSEGSMIGMNIQIGNSLIDFFAHKRMSAVKMKYNGNVPSSHPVPWLNKWLNEGESQAANQETENVAYVLNVDNDLKKGSFKGFKL